MLTHQLYFSDARFWCSSIFVTVISEKVLHCGHYGRLLCTYILQIIH